MRSMYINHADVPSACYKCRIYMYDLHKSQWAKNRKKIAKVMDWVFKSWFSGNGLNTRLFFNFGQIFAIFDDFSK